VSYRLFEMLKMLISTPSISSTIKKFDQSNLDVIELLANWLDKIGFKIEILPIDDNHNKYNLVAILGPKNNISKGLVLSGHSDTVPYDEGKWNTNPFQLTELNGRLYGLGTSDMKSFFAIIISSIEELNLRSLKQPLIIIATADEESSMAGARSLIKSGRQLGSYAIIGEPTDLRPVSKHKGTIAKNITLMGTSGHSSNPKSGNSALEGIYDVLGALIKWRETIQTKFIDSIFPVPVPTVNFAYIKGGDSFNRICAQCTLHIDIRILPLMEISQITDDIEKIVKQIAGKRNLQYTLSSLIPVVLPMETSKNSKLLTYCEIITGYKATGVSYTTEGSLFSSMGLETVILGPGNIEQAHKPNEYIEVKNIQPMIKIIKKLISKFCLG